MNHFLPIDDASRVAEVRRLAVNAAREEGLDETLAGHVALVATESATNILKHARAGWVQIGWLSDRGAAGVEILAIDQGPGIANLPQCLTDGYSSAGTAGNGLGAISRLSHRFDVYSEPGKGTVLVSQIFAAGRPESAAIAVGGVRRPMAGEEACGDAWAVRIAGATALVLVSDGLGHGVQAAEASTDAVVAFKKAQEAVPSALVGRVHTALRGTRGAAVAVAFIDFAGGCVHFSGVGNIAGVIAGPDKSQSMVSHYGTAGHEVRKIGQFSYSLAPGAVVVMHSDGLTSGWSLNDHVGLNGRHPSVIAGVIYRDATRGRDDACVVAIRGMHL